MTPLEKVIQKLNAKRCGAGWRALCPAHKDSKPSLSINEGKNGKPLIHCHAGCTYEEIIKAAGITTEDLFPADHIPNRKKTKRKTVAAASTSTFNWQKCVKAFSAKHVEQIAGWRGFSQDFVRHLKDIGYIGIFRSVVAFPVHNSGKIVGCHWRKRGGDHWEYHPKRKVKAAPLIFGTLSPGKPVHCFESTWDGLDLMDKAGARDGVLITRGSENWKFVLERAPKNSPLLLWTQNDVAAATWEGNIVALAQDRAKLCKVPAQHKDLNDWTRAGATAEDLAAVVKNAQPIKILLSDCCFDAGRNHYLIKTSRGAWIALNETQFKRELRLSGLSPVAPYGSHVSPIDARLSDIQHNLNVRFAGVLAGYDAGIQTQGDHRILVTESPRIIEPRPGDWPMLHALINGMFNLVKKFGQPDYLYGWLKVAFEALRARNVRPGQAIVLAGGADCGKSLFQNLITKMLGGRAARPYQFMSGLTPFNADLFGAEHLMIEDEESSTDIRARRSFGAHLKELTVIDWQRCHAKNRTPIMLRPFWRVSISVNDEPENLMVLPPLDESLADKFIMLHAAKKPMPMPTATLQQRDLFWETLVSELPAFLDFLLQWQIPWRLQSERFGITHFHHPEILEELDSLSPEFKLLTLIDDQIFGDIEDNQDWGPHPAETLERCLTRPESPCQKEASRLFTFNTACGVYLGRLKKKFPGRFIFNRTETERLWTIKPPLPRQIPEMEIN
jgi:hypothetical protein